MWLAHRNCFAKASLLSCDRIPMWTKTFWIRLPKLCATSFRLLHRKITIKMLTTGSSKSPRSIVPNSQWMRMILLVDHRPLHLRLLLLVVLLPRLLLRPTHRLWVVILRPPLTTHRLLPGLHNTLQRLQMISQWKTNLCTTLSSHSLASIKVTSVDFRSSLRWTQLLDS